MYQPVLANVILYSHYITPLKNQDLQMKWVGLNYLQEYATKKLQRKEKGVGLIEFALQTESIGSS